MNAPDKVYYTQTEHVANYFTTGKPFERDCIEYIRKDVLMEWAKKKNKRIDTEEGDYSLGYVSAMIDLIEKIESI